MEEFGLVKEDINSQYIQNDVTPAVSMEMFALNRNRLIHVLKSLAPRSIVLLNGGIKHVDYEVVSDHFYRPESYFLWAFGVTEPGYVGVIDVITEKSYLFIPKLPAGYTVWMGKFEKPEDLKKKYGIDEVYYIFQITFVIAPLNRETILILKNKHSETKLLFPLPHLVTSSMDIDDKILYPIMTELRVIKTSYEIDLLRYVNKISSEAHKFVMKKMRSEMYEFQAEALFLYYAYFVGACRNHAKPCICGSGHNSSILHYGYTAIPNKKINVNDMCLFDMGASYYGYFADISVSFPISGTFTKQQKIVYNAVLTARNVILEYLRPGILLSDIHRLGQEEILRYLKQQGLLNGCVKRMFEDGLGYVFQPHGCGRLLGTGVFDEGSTNNSLKESAENGSRYLSSFCHLQEGMVLCVEPGCYFIDKLLDEAIYNPSLKEYIHLDVLKEFRGMGGVRLKDNILITVGGYENFTDLPRTVGEIEDTLSYRVSETVVLGGLSKERNYAKNLMDRINLILDCKFSKQIENFGSESKMLKKDILKKSNKKKDCFPCSIIHDFTEEFEELKPSVDECTSEHMIERAFHQDESSDLFDDSSLLDLDDEAKTLPYIVNDTSSVEVDPLTELIVFPGTESPTLSGEENFSEKESWRSSFKEKINLEHESWSLSASQSIYSPIVNELSNQSENNVQSMIDSSLITDEKESFKTTSNEKITRISSVKSESSLISSERELLSISEDRNVEKE